jgi:predicted DNA-binding protein YlxM (UPF0122 family)
MGQYGLSKGENFQKRKEDLANQSKLVHFDPGTAKKNEICSLFVSKRESIREIAKTQNVDQQTVVQVLIENGLIRERRRNLGSMNDRERRRSLLKAYIDGLETNEKTDTSALADNIQGSQSKAKFRSKL